MTSVKSIPGTAGTAMLLTSLMWVAGACGGATGWGNDADSSAGSDEANGADVADGMTEGDGVAVADGTIEDDGVAVADGTTEDDGVAWFDGINPLAMPVDLGAASHFAILAKSGISTVPPSAITGDIGTSPAAATFITGFSLIADSTNVFATSTQVTGKVYAADYAPPTPANMTAAIGDMELAFTDAAGRAPDATELGAGNIGGMTLPPGVYKWGTGLLIPTDVTLSGSSTDVWIFQIAQNLTVASGVKVLLTGGALPGNVFWQAAGLIDLGTTAQFQGVVLAQTSITMRTGASINGRVMSQTSVNIDSSTVVIPAP